MILFDFDELKNISTKVLSNWSKGYPGWAPKEVTRFLESAKLDWLISLTDCLEVWYKKGTSLIIGELLLARANLGALVEGWLKFLYTVYYLDYLEDPNKKVNNNGKMIDPQDLSFEQLRQFSSTGALWISNDSTDKWVLNVQQKRNAIHAFKHRDVGTALDFLNDVQEYYDFISKIIFRLPPEPDYSDYI